MLKGGKGSYGASFNGILMHSRCGSVDGPSLVAVQRVVSLRGNAVEERRQAVDVDGVRLVSYAV